MNWCDPCAADPLSHEELRELGVFWLAGGGDEKAAPLLRPAPSQPRNVFVTRLHVRYDAARFPDDLVFQMTGDTENFQGRYVLRHAWDGQGSCEAATTYRKALPERWEREAQTLASLTGWNVNDIRAKMKLVGPPPTPGPWWERIWGE
jgi:hypothetical protein